MSHVRLFEIRPSSLPYDRRRDLPGLLPLWPEEIEDTSLEGRRQLVVRLRSALRRERRRGIAGEWTYSVARHRQLVIAYRAELSALQALECLPS